MPKAEHGTANNNIHHIQPSRSFMLIPICITTLLLGVVWWLTPSKPVHLSPGRDQFFIAAEFDITVAEAVSLVPTLTVCRSDHALGMYYAYNLPYYVLQVSDFSELHALMPRLEGVFDRVLLVDGKQQFHTNLTVASIMLQPLAEYYKTPQSLPQNGNTAFADAFAAEFLHAFHTPALTPQSSHAVNCTRNEKLKIVILTTSDERYIRSAVAAACFHRAQVHTLRRVKSPRGCDVIFHHSTPHLIRNLHTFDVAVNFDMPGGIDLFWHSLAAGVPCLTIHRKISNPTLKNVLTASNPFDSEQMAMQLQYLVQFYQASQIAEEVAAEARRTRNLHLDFVRTL